MRSVGIFAAAIVATVVVGCATMGDRSKDLDKLNAIRARAERILVKVTFKLRKNQAIDPDSSIYDGRLIQLISRGGRLTMMGFLVSKDGMVVVEDPRIQEKDLDRIEVTTFGGATSTARPEAIVRRAPGLVLRMAQPPAGAEDLDLAIDRNLAFGDRIMVAMLRPEEEKMTLTIAGGAVTSVENDGAISVGKGTKLIMDDAGTPIGISLIDIRGEEMFSARNPFWRIGEYAAENRIALAAIAKTTDLVRASADPWRVNVRFFLKRDEESGDRAEAEMMRYIRSSSYGDRGSQNLEDRRFLGIVLNADGRVFIPTKLPLPVINMLGDIEAVAADGKTYKGKFVGAYKELGGMLIDFPELKPAALPVMSAERPKKGDLFYTLSQEKKRGQEYVEAVYNRVAALSLDELELEKEIYINQPDHKVKEGSILVNGDGAILGIYTTVEKDGQDEGRYGGYSRYGSYYSRTEGDIRMVYVADLQKPLADPAPFFDPRAIVHSREEKGRLVWLGVEWQAVDRTVAEQLDILKHTADGRRGLLITSVYPSSPAEKIGLTKGDTLLYLIEEGKGENEKKEFMAGGSGYYDDYDRYGFGRRSRAAAWKDRRNYLTELLTKIGKEKKVTLHYLKGKEPKSINLALDEAPPDQSNAKHYKCEPFGLTVKDLTYEVKHFMKYPPGKAGVVVSRVEPGSGAAVAKVFPTMIVLKVNNVEVKDHAHFREIVEQLRAQKPEYITLYCEAAGDSMFAEVQAKWNDDK